MYHCIQSFSGLSLHHLCHVIVLVMTKFIQSPVSPSSYLSFRLKLMFCGLLGMLWAIHACSWVYCHAIATFLVAGLPCTTLAIQHQFHVSWFPLPLFSPQWNYTEWDSNPWPSHLKAKLLTIWPPGCWWKLSCLVRLNSRTSNIVTTTGNIFIGSV